MNKVEGLCQGTGIITRRAYFREEETFLSGIPSMENSNYIKEATKRNVLTNGLVATYPFISSSIFDDEGIFIGTNIYNNSLVFMINYWKNTKDFSGEEFINISKMQILFLDYLCNEIKNIYTDKLGIPVEVKYYKGAISIR